MWQSPFLRFTVIDNYYLAPNNILSKVLCVPMDSINWSSFIVLICGESSKEEYLTVPYQGFYLTCDSIVFISLVAYKKLMTRMPRNSILYALLDLTILLYTCKDKHERGRLLKTLINDGMPLFFFSPLKVICSQELRNNILPICSLYVSHYEFRDLF